MANEKQAARLKRREPMSDAQMLMTISICIFVAMYVAAMLTLKGGFLKPQQIFDLLNDNAALIIISCSLTIVMIGGGINISVGGVIGLTVMACAIFLNENGIQNDALSIAATYSGWHYRMELYRRFAVTPQGWTNIDVMPPEIRAEYAKHDYHPRFRDIKAKMLGTIVFTPLLFAFGGTLFCAAALAHKAMAAKGRS